jgi:carboxyl-terminal processing protease
MTVKNSLFYFILMAAHGKNQTMYSDQSFRQMSHADQLAFLDQAIKVIQKNYVDALPAKDLLMGAVEGMLSRADPHSSYLTDEMYQKLRQKMQSKMAGIGVELSIDNGALVVISPLDGSPAARSGLQPGDRIVAVDRLSVETFPMLSKAIQAIQGPVGSSVSLTVERKGHVAPLPFYIRREAIDVPPVRWEKIGPVGYIRISSFNEKTADLLKKALIELPKAKGPFYGYVLDLRNNPGGLVHQALQCCDFLIDRGALLFTKGRTGPYQSYQNAKPQNTLVHNKPCVVLINKGSASASEIMAGALQDHKSAIIVGTQSFGKGSVQNIFPLSQRKDMGKMKLTIARFYTPLKHPIQGYGIRPDVVVEPLPPLHRSFLQGLEKSTLVKSVLSDHRLREEDLPRALKKEAITHDQQRDDVVVQSQSDAQLFSAITILKTLWLSKHSK